MREKLAELLFKLDKALTEKEDDKWIQQNQNNQMRLINEPERFVIACELYYLSDGGYSRLVYHFNYKTYSGRLSLRGNTPSGKTTKNWDKCKELRKELENYLDEVVKELCPELF